MAVLLKDALRPNLVQTFEGGPALVHGGPFANIAHGCSSLVATYTALGHADYVVTEAGFASELGAEKFFDIKCRIGGIWPHAVVVVATCRALKMHGLDNLDKHIENIACFGFQPVVALNRFDGDSEQDVTMLEQHCRKRGLRFACSDAFARGGAGAEDLGREVLAAADQVPTDAGPLYPLSMSPEEKISTIARRMYGARGAIFDGKAMADLERVRRLGLETLPVCIAKTQKSLSDDPTRLGRPTDFDVTVREVRIAAGAGFLVAIAGSILTMPGLPREPAAMNIDLDDDGRVRGLF
jgi:formate--tetrahydrofolate ligase